MSADIIEFQAHYPAYHRVEDFGLSVSNVLALIMAGIVGEVQICAVPGRYLDDNLRLLRYTLEMFNKFPAKSGALVHLD